MTLEHVGAYVNIEFECKEVTTSLVCVCMLLSIQVVYRYMIIADVVMECFDWNF